MSVTTFAQYTISDLTPAVLDTDGRLTAGLTPGLASGTLSAMHDAVLFDMDGVLLDSYHAHWLSWRDSCARRGIVITAAQYAGLFGQSFRSFTEALHPAPLTAAESEVWHEEKEGGYREIIRCGMPLMPGARDLIRQLDEAGFRLGIASSGPRENVDCLLEHLNGDGRIRASRSAGDVSRCKPHPDVFLACAEALATAPRHCLVVEDSIHGLQGARAAGMATAALTGTATADALTPFADVVIDTLDVLTPTLARHLIQTNALDR